MPAEPPPGASWRVQVNLIDRHLAELFEHLRVNCVIDVGANVGSFGAGIRANGFTGPIASFEPASNDFSALERRSRSDPLWRSYPFALGSVNEIADFNVTSESVFNSFLKPNDFAAEMFPGETQVERTERVEVRRLDDIFAEITRDVAEPRVYLKLDTQGWDLEVLEGAKASLDHVVAFQSEVSVVPIYGNMSTFTTSIERFDELGFALSGLFPVNMTATFEVIEFDCVVVRKQ